MATKADKNEMRISKHEEVCSERYRNIHDNIADLKSTPASSSLKVLECR